jgi:hypothetical protein
MTGQLELCDVAAGLSANFTDNTRTKMGVLRDIRRHIFTYFLSALATPESRGDDPFDRNFSLLTAWFD